MHMARRRIGWQRTEKERATRSKFERRSRIVAIDPEHRKPLRLRNLSIALVQCCCHLRISEAFRYRAALLGPLRFRRYGWLDSIKRENYGLELRARAEYRTPGHCTSWAWDFDFGGSGDLHHTVEFPRWLVASFLEPRGFLCSSLVRHGSHDCPLVQRGGANISLDGVSNNRSYSHIQVLGERTLA